MFSRRSSFKNSWPRGVPRLYPQLNERRLCKFMSYQQYKEISQFPIISIHPPCCTDDPGDIVLLAVGLSRVLIRNLMLVPKLSIRGPEDTALVPYDSFFESVEIPQIMQHFITGRLSVEQGFLVEFEIFAPTQQTCVRVHSPNFSSFIQKCSELLTSALGGSISSNLRQQWGYGQPKTVEQLMTYAEIVLEDPDTSDNDQANDREIVSMFQTDPTFVLPLHELSDTAKDKRRLYLQGLQADPFDAQLCFLLFIDLWASEGSQPEAVQFLRKAIELSPGHGKAHMCTPHAAPKGVDLIRHSELGYRLLPGNSFAVNNYIIYLRERGEGPAQLFHLALEGIENDPYDPTNYEWIIKLYLDVKNDVKALEYAVKLKGLYGPPMHERTLYCLQQNPVIKARLEAGTYDPVQRNNTRINTLQRHVSS